MSPFHAAPPTRPPPGRAGIGLRAPHYRNYLALPTPRPWVEVHSENCFLGGRHLDVLLQVRRDCEVSLHGVGLSLGSADPLCERHLAALKQLVDRVQPALVSDHLSWSSIGGVYANDLLPLPCTAETLAHVAQRVARVQDHLGRQLLVENVSSYLEFGASEMSEWDFLAELARRSGCAVLLDLNNLHVSARNHGTDPLEALDTLAPHTVHEYHLAGHSVKRLDGVDGTPIELLVDTHSRPVDAAVWELYDAALQRIGARPTIVEWDNDLPALDTLLAQAEAAQARLDRLEAHDASAA